MKIALHLDVGHDRNGNPRRIFVVLDGEANVLDTIDEGYEGNAALTKRWGKIPTVDLDTTPAQYRELRRMPRRSR